MTIQFSLEIEVHDERAFRKAIRDGLTRADAASYRNPDKKSLDECAQMIFDPGVSPDGCDILGSSAEEVPGEAEWLECAKCGVKLDSDGDCPMCDNPDLPKGA